MQPRILLVACFVVISALVLPSEERVVRKGHAAAHGPEHTKRGEATPKDAGSDPRRNHPMASLKERATLKRHENAEDHAKRGVGHPKDTGANLERNHPMAPLKQRATLKGQDNDKRHDKRVGRVGPPLKDTGLNLQYSPDYWYDGEVNDTVRYWWGYSDGYSFAKEDDYYGTTEGRDWYNDICFDPGFISDDVWFMGACAGYLYYIAYGGDYQYDNYDNYGNYDGEYNWEDKFDTYEEYIEYWEYWEAYYEWMDEYYGNYDNYDLEYNWEDYFDTYEEYIEYWDAALDAWIDEYYANWESWDY